MGRKRKVADLLKKAAQDTTSQTLHQFFSPGPSKKIMTGRDTTQPAEEAAADEEECRIMSQSAPCPVSEAECTVHVDVASSGCDLTLGLGDNVPLGTTASFERSEIFIRSQSSAIHRGVIYY